MAVLLSNCRLGVRRAEPGGRDAHGAPTSRGWGAVGELLPGYADEGPDAAGEVDEVDSRPWTLGLDPALWPVARGDVVVDGAGREWLVLTADLETNSACHAIDWVRVTAHSRAGGGTRP
ncbi:hypothetical protein [Actinomadura yumaensis]|uniref:Uncharacterized protein n=1 Tax=Actinomadura yumaensis TaxID=111807 RepID=A0ABW2CRW0_9ACTN